MPVPFSYPATVCQQQNQYALPAPVSEASPWELNTLINNPPSVCAAPSNPCYNYLTFSDAVPSDGCIDWSMSIFRFFCPFLLSLLVIFIPRITYWSAFLIVIIICVFCPFVLCTWSTRWFLGYDFSLRAFLWIRATALDHTLIIICWYLLVWWFDVRPLLRLHSTFSSPLSCCPRMILSIVSVPDLVYFLLLRFFDDTCSFFDTCCIFIFPFFFFFFFQGHWDFSLYYLA